MKLSENTITILKNFSTINNTILVKPGNVLQTMAIPSRAIFAKAFVEEEFPQQFAIYELSTLIGALSIFDEPEIEFFEKHLTITSGRQQVRYTFAEPSMVVAPPDKGVTMPEADVSFNLSSAEFTRLIRAAGVFKLPHITITGDGSVVRINAEDAKDPSKNTFGIDVGQTKHTFNMIIDVQNIIRLLSRDYNVSMVSKGICEFQADNLVYYVVCEHDSHFEKGE